MFDFDDFRYTIYDCEIAKCIPEKNGANDPNYQYCEGWRDFKNMGLSCFSLYTNISGDDELLVFVDDEIFGSHPDQFKTLNNTNVDVLHFSSCLSFNFDELVIGFNSFSFDDFLINHENQDAFSHSFIIQTDYDLLLEIRLAAYGSFSWKNQPKGFSYSLDKMAQYNHLKKIGSGSNAPKQYQDGHYDDLIQYCANDAEITNQLFWAGIRGELVDPNNGRFLQLRHPYRYYRQYAENLGISSVTSSIIPF